MQGSAARRIHVGDDLRRELALFGQEFSDLDWYSRQLQFLESHTYFTASARALRDAGQLRNIHVLEKMLEGIRSQ